MTLLETLEDRRKALKMTQGAFSKHLGIDPGDYSRFLTTRRQPTAGFLLKVQRAFPELIRDTLETAGARRERVRNGAA